MSDVGRGAGMGFGLIFGICAALVLIPVLGMLFLCGGCATIVGTSAVAVDDAARREAARIEAGQQLPAAHIESASAVGGDGGSKDAEPSALTGDSTSKTETREVDQSTVITMSEFNQLREGMSYDDAFKVIGYHGTEVSSSDLLGHKTIMLAWKNDDGTNANAMFQDGLLISRAQFGLPPGPSPLNVEKARQGAEAELVRQRQREEQKRLEAEAAEQHRIGMIEVNKRASAELEELLSSAGDMSTSDAIDSFVAKLTDFIDKHADAEAAAKAKRESAALSALRLAYVFSEKTKRTATYKFKEVADEFPGTIAAKAAQAKIDGNSK